MHKARLERCCAHVSVAEQSPRLSLFSLRIIWSALRDDPWHSIQHYSPVPGGPEIRYGKRPYFSLSRLRTCVEVLRSEFGDDDRYVWGETVPFFDPGLELLECGVVPANTHIVELQRAS